MEIEQRFVELDFVQLLESMRVRKVHHRGDQLNHGVASFSQFVIGGDERDPCPKERHQRIRRVGDRKLFVLCCCFRGRPKRPSHVQLDLA